MSAIVAAHIHRSRIGLRIREEQRGVEHFSCHSSRDNCQRILGHQDTIYEASISGLRDPKPMGHSYILGSRPIAAVVGMPCCLFLTRMN